MNLEVSKRAASSPQRQSGAPNRSDLYWWLFAIIPTIAVSFALLREQSVVLLLPLMFALLTCGERREQRFTATLGRLYLAAIAAGVGYWLVGFQVMYPSLGEPIKMDFSGEFIEMDYRIQTSFALWSAVLLSASIASFAIWPLKQVAFAIVFGCVVYPLMGRWFWGDGWLLRLGFLDSRGGVIIVALAGWFALGIAATNRHSNATEQGKSKRRIGTWLRSSALVLFWFFFAGPSQLLLSDTPEIYRLSFIFSNALLFSGGLVALIVERVIMGSCSLNRFIAGGLSAMFSNMAGLVVSADWSLLVVGCVAGGACVLGTHVLDTLSIPDPHSLISALALGGSIGALAVVVFPHLAGLEPTLSAQCIGVATAMIFGITSGGAVAKIGQLLQPLVNPKQTSHS